MKKSDNNSNKSRNYVAAIIIGAIPVIIIAGIVGAIITMKYMELEYATYNYIANTSDPGTEMVNEYQDDAYFKDKIENYTGEAPDVMKQIKEFVVTEDNYYRTDDDYDDLVSAREAIRDEYMANPEKFEDIDEGNAIDAEPPVDFEYWLRYPEEYLDEECTLKNVVVRYRSDTDLYAVEPAYTNEPTIVSGYKCSTLSGDIILIGTESVIDGRLLEGDNLGAINVRFIGVYNFMDDFPVFALNYVF